MTSDPSFRLFTLFTTNTAGGGDPLHAAPRVSVRRALGLSLETPHPAHAASGPRLLRRCARRVLDKLGAKPLERSVQRDLDSVRAHVHDLRNLGGREIGAVPQREQIAVTVAGLRKRL